MTIGIIRETDNDKRVAILPEGVKTLKELNVDTILVEKGAGKKAFVEDRDYEQVGGVISDRKSILSTADIVIRINGFDNDDLGLIRKETILLSAMNPLGNNELTSKLIKMGITSFSMDMVPRTTRAQSMDILSSMATIAGYYAVLKAATHLPKFFPMFMTAAGSIAPAKVLVLGAGVAGLQAIATARRLGAVVEAFDVRSAVKEEVKSLGAKFVEVKGAKEDASAGGYAVEQTEEYKRLQQEAINDSAIKSDVIIATAQIPGRAAPILIPKSTVEKMKPGAVIIDLAASTGGNCEVTENDKIVRLNGVTIIGDSNLPSEMPMDASKMYGKNTINFLKLIIKEGQINLNFDDDIVKGTCITHQGEVLNDRVKAIFNK